MKHDDPIRLKGKEKEIQIKIKSTVRLWLVDDSMIRNVQGEEISVIL